MYIRQLKEVSKKDTLHVGGKAASLGEMLHMGINVPAGFVITTEAFRDGMTRQLEQEIQNAFRELGAERVAVRSSAVAEDSETASWAGQLDTYLNIATDGLIEAILGCWNSIKAEGAVAYASEHSVDEESRAVAVIIQAMVDSAVSGVMFTASPITHNHGEMMIESIYGLGELLVQGAVYPDSFIMDKYTGKVTRHRAHHQQIKQVFKNGKNAKSALTHDELATPSLKTTQIKQLVELGKTIESHYSSPQDIEWAIEKGAIFIVQSRPITALGGEMPGWYHKSRRFGTILEESLAMPAQSAVLKEELGVGYDEAITVSGKGHYVLWEDENRVAAAEWELRPTPYYIPLTVDLEKTLDAAILNPEKVNFETAFAIIARHLALYGLAKNEADRLYSLANTTSSDKKAIELWRNEDHFSGYDQLWKLVAEVVGLATAELHYLTIDEVRGLLNKKPGLTSKPANHPGAVWSLIFKDDILELVLKDLSPIPEESTAGEIMGQVAYGTGESIRGVVGKGIIVAVMTTSDMIGQIKKAKAVVTDEGGILSHAAIMCRELKTPCIIGTRIATWVLGDGDKVEIDTATGLVTKVT